MITIHCPEHLIQTFKFAAQVGVADRLAERLEFLAQFGDQNNICELHRDSAPHSFSFLMRHPSGTPWFNGGLIYSGPRQPLDGSAPALTVGIGIDSSQHGWSIHT